MTNFMSPVEEIDRIHIYKTKAGRVYKGVDVVCIDRALVIRTSAGALLSPSAERVSYVLGNGLASKSTLRALVALGTITEKHLRDHEAAAARADDTREKRLAADHLADAARVAGVRLTKAQQKFIDQHGKKRP